MKFSLRLSSVLPAALLGVLLSGSALAAGFYISPPGQSANSPDVGIDNAGNATFVWTVFHPTAHDVVVQMRRRSAAGVLGATTQLSAFGRDARTPQAAVNSAGAAAFVWEIDDGGRPVQGRTRSAGGALSPIFTVAQSGANPDVAIDDAGNATFTWSGRDANGDERSYARRRSANGTLGPRLTLSPAGGDNARMAVNAAGTAVFVWVWPNGAGSNRIQARRLSAAGVSGPIKFIAEGPSGGGGGAAGTWNPEVGIDSQGNALIVWEKPDGQGPCGINGCPKILSRTLSKNDVVGTVPQTFTTTVEGGEWPQVAMAGNGSAVVAWLHEGVEFRARSAGGALGPLQKFTAATNVFEPVLKGDSAGNTVAVWLDGVAGVKARARSAAGALGPVRSYSIGARGSFSGRTAVRGGNAVIAWGQSDGTTQCGGNACTRIAGAVDP